MNYQIIYSKIKHWRVRLMPDMSLKLTIPVSKKWDKDFEKKLLKKWEKLIKKFEEKNIKKIKIFDWEFILIFWEKILLKNISGNLDDFLKQRLYEAALPILEKYSQKLWISYNKFYIKNLKTIWWSCSWIQNISLNLKLVHLPIKFLEYVIIHEVCHLKEKNHWVDFWNLVGEYCEDYSEIRRELKSIRI